MPDSSVPDRDAFLGRIAARLPFDRVENRDILDELDSHLTDSAAQLEAGGLSRDAAERTAIERLGPPERLASSLTEARRSRRRTLAAVGAGTYAALGGAVYGYIFALLVVMGVSIATVLLASGPLHLFGGSWGAVPGTTTTTVAALAVAAYVAGHKLTTIAAARAGYHIALVRRISALVGGGFVLWYALVGWSGALTWPEVAMLLSLPAWFAVGAWRATTAPFPSRRWRLEVIGLALVGIPAALALGISQSGGSSGGNSFSPSGVDRIGLPTPATIRAAIVGSDESGTNAVTGEATLTIAFDDPAVLSGWSGFRFEAWPGIRTGGDYPDDWKVDPDASGPFATARARFETAQSSSDGRARLTGSVTIDRDPKVTLAWLALTGVGPDGQRHILEGLSYATTAFDGTVLDWLTAVSSGP